MKNAIITILGIAVVGLGSYVVVLKRGGEQTTQPPAMTEKEIAVVISTAEGSAVTPTEGEPEQTVAQLEKAHNLIAALYEDNQVLEKEAEPSLAKGIRQVVQSPEMRAMIRKGRTKEITESHERLFRKLGLTAEQQTALIDLLAEQELAGIETGIHWMTGNIEEASAQSVALREEMHAKIKEQLGDEVLGGYQYWEATKNERESVTRFSEKLGADGLGEEMSDQLVAMMYDTRGEFAELDDLSQPENFDLREMDPARRAEILGQVDELHGRYVEEAATMLAPEQLEQYSDNLGQDREGLDKLLTYMYGMFNADAMGEDH